MIALLRRFHRWLQDRQASARVRVALTLLVVGAAVAVGWSVIATAMSLNAQQQGILAALAKANAKDEDPAALQLFTRNTVTANGRDYGGVRQIPRPVDLFDDDGTMSAATKRDLAWRLVADQVPAWIPAVLVRDPLAAWLAVGGAAAVLGAIVWTGLAVAALELGTAFAALVALFVWAGWPLMAQGTVAVALSLLLFGFLWRSASGLLGGRNGVIAVARTTVLEGVRTLAAPAFVVPIAVLLPLLALSRDQGQALYLAIPGFLDWGHTVVYTCAALLVIFFGCATTSFEMRDRQVWSVLTKPMSRFGWMLGKWIGTMALALVVLGGGGLLIWAGAHFLASQRPVDEADAREVRDTVLVARVGTQPEWDFLSGERLREIVQQTIDGDAVLKADLAARRQDDATVRRELAVNAQKKHLEAQRRIMPGDAKVFTFRGLATPASARLPMSLRYKLHAGADDIHERFPVVFEYQSGTRAGQWEVREYVPIERYSLPIDPSMVDTDGTMRIRILNVGIDEQAKKFVPTQVSIYIEEDDLEVMATQATFAENMVSAMLIDTVKVAFLASLAVVAGALLSFPIAVLLAFGIFSMATLTPFLANSLRDYRVDWNSGAAIGAFQAVVRSLAVTIEFLLHGFAARSPSDALAQGRAITLAGLFDAFVSIGLAWGGGVLLLGWAAIRRKEIAVYSGQG